MNENAATDSMIRPFPTAPDIRRYFPASVVEEARERLSRTITRSEGPAHLVGTAGTGKSLLLEVLAAQFRDQMSVVSLIGAQLCTRRALLQMILFELKLPYKGMDEGELRLSLIEFLRGDGENLQPILLLVDEADSLPTRLLQELRVLTNVSYQGQPLVNLILAGSSILEERFADPELEIFNQRIAARCYLSPLGREETFGYVRSQVAASGGDVDQLFCPGGLEAIYTVTDGVPRLINQLGDQLIWMTQETGYQPLDEAIVQQAWSDLQQLPAPWNHSATHSTDQTDNRESESEVVEFGDLSDISTLVPEDSSSPHMGTLDDQEQAGDEEMPASIPFESQQTLSARNNSPKDKSSHSESVEGMKTIDDTEELLQNLDEIYVQPIVEPVANIAPEVINPFEESFTSEELVIDQYASFAPQLLSSAACVVNHQDKQFASELQRCELGAMQLHTVVAGNSVHQHKVGQQKDFQPSTCDRPPLLVQGHQLRKVLSQLESPSC
jgi:type II secretory pathway predicted ATPase ExeA